LILVCRYVVRITRFFKTISFSEIKLSSLHLSYFVFIQSWKYRNKSTNRHL